MIILCSVRHTENHISGKSHSFITGKSHSFIIISDFSTLLNVFIFLPMRQAHRRLSDQLFHACIK